MIYRPFDLEPFTKGIPQGTDLLLRKLRGESLDWSGIEEKLIPKQTCLICKTRADKSKFEPYEFKKKKDSAVCLECMEDVKGELDEWTHHFCENCQNVKPANKFTMTERQRQYFRKTHCADCYAPKRGGLRTLIQSKNDQSKSRKLLCSDCEKTFDFKPSGHITHKMREEHLGSRRGKVLCYECYEEGKLLLREDREQTKTRKLMCSECEQPFDFVSSGHITEKMREEHLRSRQRKVLCYRCHDQRPTYTCSRCSETGHREDFQKTHFEQDCARGTQQCLECKSGRRKGKVCIVDVCRKFVSGEILPASEKIYRNRSLVCAEC